MFSHALVVALSALAVSERIIPPAEAVKSLAQTDVGTIASLVTTVELKGGPAVDEVPDLPPSDTLILAENGELTGAERDISSNRFITPRSIAKRRYAAVEGSAYLTYTVVSNATYNVADCLNFCTRVDGCVFVNLYYEHNNYGLDFEVSEKSNLKCVAFAEVHTAQEKTNVGGQQSYPAPAPLTYITQSSGWALKSIADPDTPEGYNLYTNRTRPTRHLYLDFALLDKYDVAACARLCNEHAPSTEGGSCQFFNIWRASVNHVPKTYTCTMYTLPTDQGTATYAGEGELKVSFSRGYSRKNFAFDGGFEAYAGCVGCFDESYDNWVALLGSAIGNDALPGTLSPAAPLTTVPGKEYQISFWQNSAYSGPTFQKDAWFEVIWNGKVIQTFRPGYSDWSYISVKVTATGSDTVAIHGGAAPAWTFIDDIAVWQL
ncbi:hypothetical protein BKA70DRAFT_1377997 [Coprinopsis sp. MPI-PUGE-AT-0042]|nr:hypothetical protein BKA70DRAFT_1377997 [Coprinopsis sp. MPI-PUGE-AT-0042]